tara:strand:- start:3360 stop:3593 length:234 start_codon:yes stop_codon:yes gene_type:complete
MNYKIFKHNNTLYKVLRKIPEDQCNPRIYGINSTDWMKVLHVWKTWCRADHVLRTVEGDKVIYLLCETIQDAEIISE